MGLPFYENRVDSVGIFRVFSVLEGFSISPNTVERISTNSAGDLRFHGTTSGIVTLKPAAVAGTWSMTLPTSGGTSGFVLSTDGAGATSWVAQSAGSGSPGGSDTQVQFNDAGSFGGDSKFVFDKATGNTTITGALVSTSHKVTSGNVIGWVASTKFISSVDGKVQLSNNAVSAGVGLDVTTDAVLKIRTTAQSADASLTVLDEVYGIGWDGSLQVPTKNAVYDKIQTLTGGTPGGSDTQVQFNDSSAFGGDADLTWDKTANVLAVTGSVTVSDSAYGAGWNGSTAVPTRNAVYDKIETISAGTPSILRTFLLMGA